MLENLKNYRIILASGSPRRKELLTEMGISFETILKKGIEETYPESLNAKLVPEYLAIQKASAYADELKNTDTIIITADTIVLHDEGILGKPSSEENAIDMLKQLSGKTHRVISGVAITTATKQISFSVKTKVNFRTLSDEDIEYYVHKFKPLDKAGAYGIQEWIGLVGIDHIEGSYHNVMGLPTQRLFAELKNI